MRVLIGYTDRIPELRERKPLPGRKDDILCFGNGYDHLACDPASHHYADLAAQFPDGWKPDVYIHWSPEYNPVPLGVGEADCFTVGVVGDWNLGGQAVQMVGGVFDLLVADRRGCERLRALGYERVVYAPLWAYDPDLHRRLPDMQRDLDVVMLGSFNYNVHKERAKLLARIARLSDRYRIFLGGNVYGEEYTRTLNRAKIVFNRSVGGAINMRAYEAPACGALLFYERDNPEIGSLFTDREECVLYGDDDLEALLEYYLTHDEERERIAEAGWRKVQSHTYANHLAHLLDLVEREREAGYSPSRRPFVSLPTAERYRRFASQHLVAANRASFVPVEWALNRAQELEPHRVDLMHARACLIAELGIRLQEPQQSQSYLQLALDSLNRVLSIAPEYVAARLNRALILLRLSDPKRAEEDLREAIGCLQSVPPPVDRLMGPYFPQNEFGAAKVELERIWITYPPGASEWVEAMRRWLLWRAYETICDLAYERLDFAAAVDFAQKAVALYPDAATSRFRHARALRAMGRFAQAEAEYRAALAETPLAPEIWLELGELLRETGQTERCRAFIEERLLLLEGCPDYAWLRPHLEALLRLPEWRTHAVRPYVDPEEGVLHLLSLPDWSKPEEWQGVLRAYVDVFQPGEPVSLLLCVDTDRHPPLETIVAQIERFLLDERGRELESVPDITLLNRPRSIPEWAQLLRRADALIRTGESQVTLLGPTFSPNDLVQARSMMTKERAA